MSLPIIFRRDAKREFDQAYDWYERHKAGLGEEFSDSNFAQCARQIRPKSDFFIKTL